MHTLAGREDESVVKEMRGQQAGEGWVSKQRSMVVSGKDKVTWGAAETARRIWAEEVDGVRGLT